MKFVAVLFSGFVLTFAPGMALAAGEPIVRTALYHVKEAGKEEIHCKLGDWVKVVVSTPEIESTELKPTEFKVTSSDSGYAIADQTVKSVSRVEGGKTFMKNEYHFYVELTKRVTSEVDITVADANGKANVKQHFMAH